MEHVKTTVKVELLSDFGKAAVEELGLSAMVDVDLHPDVAESITSLIYNRARDLQREADDKQPNRGGGISSG